MRGLLGLVTVVSLRGAGAGECWEVGARIDARYRGGDVWYPGKVDAVRDCLHNISYDDGDFEAFLVRDLLRSYVAPRFAVGDRVEARWLGKGAYYPGRITKVWGNTFDVVFDDGDRELGVYENDIRHVTQERRRFASAVAASRPSATENFTETLWAYLDRLELRNFTVALSPRLRSFETNIGTPLRTRTPFTQAFARDWTRMKRARGSLLRRDAGGRSYSPRHVAVARVLQDDALAVLRDYVRRSVADDVFAFGDTQTDLRFRAHNETAMRLLQFELLPLVEEVWGRRLRPTYTYLSSYLAGARLPKHTDGEQCGVSVSFILDKPEAATWPLRIAKDPHHTPYRGKAHEHDHLPPEDTFAIDVDAGGVIIFQGTDHVHYRDVLHAEYYTAILLHYCPYEGCGA